MSNVYFEPWVGCQYSEGINGKRIMVLGHVHVCDGCNNCGVEKCDDFSTQKVVEDYIVWRKNGTIPSPGYEKWLQTYLNFVKAFFGFQPEPEVEETDFWNKIMFYNYLQLAVPTPTTQAPHDAYVRAQEPFISVINSYVAKTEHSHPLGMVVSTHFRCGKGVKRGLKNGALPFNID